MKKTIYRSLGLGLVLVALLGATYLTFFNSSRGGVEFAARRQSWIEDEPQLQVPTEMNSLKALYRTINQVQKRYIDVGRVDSKAMFIAAMRALQDQVARVIVRSSGNELAITIDNETQKYYLNEVNSPWVLLQRIKDVYAFLMSRLAGEAVDYQDVEYAMINKMLQTLDPHSVFLDPNQFREMKDKTQGNFGGLGIVIGLHDGVLTVISPIDGTPAHQAGLLAGDQIVKIGDVSTVNLPLDEAVSFLRGEPGTTVEVYILRKNWEEPRQFLIKRAIVKVESIEAQDLKDRVGYVKIKDFQGNTPMDLSANLKAFAQKKYAGLVLDLRGCPGGLLEAAIRVADCFLKAGAIVTTAGQGPTDRDVRYAKDDGDEPNYPIVVLVDRGSASASEIVAGALKNHERALLVGDRTFGKGSVQVLYDFQDGSALKLTTAQYLTPGDISIQSVGVEPHVEVLPVRADAEVIDLVVQSGYRESDLNHSLANSQADHGQGPRFSLRYLETPPLSTGTVNENGDGGVDDEEPFFASAYGVAGPFEPDFEIELARKLVLFMAKKGGVKATLALVAPLVEDTTRAEEKKLVAALAKLDVDWRDGGDAIASAAANGLTSARFKSSQPLQAGGEGRIVVSVSNLGDKAIHRLLATSKSDFRPLEERELVFGRVGPGETVERTLKFKVPKDALRQTDDVLWTFFANQKEVLSPIALRTTVQALPRPRFAYSLQIDDRAKGNGDGSLQAGETVDLVVDLRNVGEGKSLNTYATLKGPNDDTIFMFRGRESFSELAVGGQRRAIFSFQIKPDFAGKPPEFQLNIVDVDLRVYVSETLIFPLTPALAVKAIPGGLGKTTQAQALLSRPESSAPNVASLPPGAQVAIGASCEDWYRVDFDERRFGWIPKAALTIGGNSPLAKIEPAYRTSPRLSVDPLPLVVNTPTLKITGSGVDESAVRDLYIFVDDDKVFLQSNRGKEVADPKRITFAAEVPLKEGLNHISVVAEETAKLDSRELITVRRDRADGMPYLLPTTMTGPRTPLGVLPTISPAATGQ